MSGLESKAGKTMKKRKMIAWVLGMFLLLMAGQVSAASDDWRNLSPREKDRVLRNYQRWQNLPSQDKQHLRDEWNRWQQLPEDRRERLKQRYNEQRGNRDRDRNRD
jgi:uncharacterized protein DUF3106